MSVPLSFPVPVITDSVSCVFFADFSSFSLYWGNSRKSTGLISSKRTLKVNDPVRARVVAVSIKSIKAAKIGLTMRPDGLGKDEWVEKEEQKGKKEKKERAKKPEKKK